MIAPSLPSGKMGMDQLGPMPAQHPSIGEQEVLRISNPEIQGQATVKTC